MTDTIGGATVVGFNPIVLRGSDGSDGRSITSATVNGAGHLIITYSDGSTSDAGSVGSSSGSAGAGLPSTIVSKSANYTAAAGDFVEADTTSAGFTITLPSGPTVGALVAVKKISGDTNTLTIAPSGGGTIDGDATASTVTPMAGVIVEHKGSNVWRIVSSMSTTGPAGLNGTNGTNGVNGAVSQVQDEGSTLTVRPTLNFVGANVTATDDAANSRTNITITASGTGPGALYAMGDGSDGNGNITGGTTTLARDMHYQDLTITGTGILKPNCFRIFVRGTLTIQTGGVIHADGSAASGQAGGAAATGTNQGSLAQASQGANGTAVNGAGAAGNAVASPTTSLGGTGGTGGASGGNAGGLGGSSGTMGTTWTTAPYFNSWRRPDAVMAGVNVTAVQNNALQTSGVFNVATGGGSGANDATGGGGAGGGGGGGGFVLINANQISNSGTISAKGGAGGAATTRNGGGGGGGGGGVVFVTCNAFTGTAPTATGGSAGAGTGTGSTGSVGADGTVLVRTNT